MGKLALTKNEVGEIIKLRQTGHSISEIFRKTKHGYGTVWRYIQGISVLPEYKEILHLKQGGSKERARKKWLDAKIIAEKEIGQISKRDLLIFILGIYWGEGSKKRDFNIINGDPYLVMSFVKGLLSLGVKKKDIRISFRIFSDMNKESTATFWTNFLGLNRSNITYFEIVKGNGKKRLQHGMCRVRIVKGTYYLKLFISMIDFIKSSV